MLKFTLGVFVYYRLQSVSSFLFSFLLSSDQKTKLMDFKSRYRRECLLKGTSPLHVIEACLADAILKFKFFRIPFSEWDPILSALKSTFTIKKIFVMIDFDLAINDKIHKQKLKHLHSFMENLSVHLSNSKFLTHLELVGLPFSYADIEHLGKGIDNSNSLQHICLAESKIGDEGLINIVESIKMKPNVVWLDLSNCGLTCNAGKLLASLIHFQTVARENAAWKASLREENPNLDLMGGLRRLSLSGNDLHDGVRHIAVALCEDKWFKAIDLQFCNLENTHVNQLIRAAEKNQSLILLDISNNNNLNSELLNKLKEVLKFNSSKHPSFVFASINLPKHISNVVLANCDKKKYFDYQITPSKEVNPIAKDQKRLNLRNKKMLSDDSKTTENKSPSQFKDPMIDLLKERKLRSDAEQQVIKMCSQIESARTRITKLEEEVKHLGAKQKKPSIKSVLPDKVFGNDVSNHSLTESFLICLKRLKDVLKELKLTTAAFRCSDSKDPSHEILEILDSVYAAVHEFAPKVNSLISESYRPLNNANNSSHKLTEVSDYKVPRNGNRRQFAEHCSTKLEISLFSSDPKTGKKYQYCENILNKNLSESVSTTIDRIPPSAIVKNATKNSQITNLVNSPASPKPPPVFDDPQKVQQYGASFVNEQVSSRIATNSFCVNSLKSLQNNLEEILQEFSKKTKDASSDTVDRTSTENVSDLTNQDSHYSMDFDSFRTSIKSISSIHSSIHCPSSSKSKKQRNLCTEEHGHFSSSSSSLNLSSIVDLLGNFSVEDIGSSTLTPP